MKTKSLKISVAMLTVAAIAFTVFLTSPVFSQEPVKKEGNKKMIIKVITDDNGTRTVIDTTFEIPDSLAMDSMRKEIDKVIRIGKKGREYCYQFHGMPHEFSYNFDMPDMTETMKELEELDFPEWEEVAPAGEYEEAILNYAPRLHGNRNLRMERDGQTLSDVLGDIPMDRVISYSIKDRKNGKRITIDLSDGPVIESRDKVIVIREPGRVRYKGQYPEKRVKIYRSPEKVEEPGEGADVPPPPPPPPPPAPDKSSEGKPKI